MDINEQLIDAAMMGDIEDAKELLDAGADPNIDTGIGPLLHLMTDDEYRNIGIVKLLIEKGADINIQGHVWTIPLMKPAHTGDVEMVNLLIGLGADVNYYNRKDKTSTHPAGYSVLGLAIGDGQATWRGSKDTTEYRWSDATETVKVLLDNGAHINDEEDMLFLCGGNYKIFEMLIEKGADVNSKNRGGEPILSFVGSLKYVPITNRNRMIRLLIENGADPTVKNKTGITPVDNPVINTIWTEYKTDFAKRNLALAKLFGPTKYGKTYNFNDDTAELIRERFPKGSIKTKGSRKLKKKKRKKKTGEKTKPTKKKKPTKKRRKNKEERRKNKETYK